MFTVGSLFAMSVDSLDSDVSQYIGGVLVLAKQYMDQVWVDTQLTVGGHSQ